MTPCRRASKFRAVTYNLSPAGGEIQRAGSPAEDSPLQDLRRRGRTEHAITEVVVISLGGGEHFHNHVGQTDHIPVLVEAVVVSNGPCVGKAVQTISESVGVLIVAGLLQTFGGDVDVVVRRTLEPRQ